jgi:hypothetical protein
MGEGTLYLSGTESNSANQCSHTSHGVDHSATGHVDEVVGRVTEEQVVTDLVGEGRQPSLTPAPVNNDRENPHSDEESSNQICLQLRALCQRAQSNSHRHGRVGPLKEEELKPLRHFVLSGIVRTAVQPEKTDTNETTLGVAKSKTITENPVRNHRYQTTQNGFEKDAYRILLLHGSCFNHGKARLHQNDLRTAEEIPKDIETSGHCSNCRHVCSNRFADQLE